MNIYYVIVKITLLVKITSFSYYVIFVFSQYTRGTRVTRAGQYTRGTRVTRAGQYTRGTRVTRAGQYTRGTRVTRAGQYTRVIPRGSLSGIPGGGDLGLRVGMLGGNPRMARGIGAPRGRRVEKTSKCRSRTTHVHFEKHLPGKIQHRKRV